MLWYENSEFDFSWTQPQNLLILIYMSFCRCIVGHYQLVSYWLGRWQIYRRGYFPFQNSSTTKNGTTVFIFSSQSFPPKKANFVFKKSNRTWVTLSNKIFENWSLKLIKGDLEARKSFCYCAHVCGRFFAVVRLGRRRRDWFYQMHHHCQQTLDGQHDRRMGFCPKFDQQWVSTQSKAGKEVNTQRNIWGPEFWLAMLR